MMEEELPKLSLKARIEIYFQARRIMKWRNLTEKMLADGDSLLMLSYIIHTHNKKADNPLSLTFKDKTPWNEDLMQIQEMLRGE